MSGSLAFISRRGATWPPRYDLLDGLRGLACLGVLLHHLGVVFVGHYCVMLFFAISGYCITASAQSAIRTGMSFGAFIGRRVRRIYPPYIAALMFFFGTRLLRNALHLSPVIWQANLVAWVQNLTLTQWISDLFHPVKLPGDNPTLFVAAFWSLNYEEQFYLVVGIAAILAKKGWINLRSSVLILLIAGAAWDFSRPAGPITGFFIEYWPHFALGACLFFTLAGQTRLWPRLLLVGATGLLAAVSIWNLLPWDSLTTELSKRVYVEFAVLSVVTLTLILLRPLSEPIARSVLWRPVALLGLISYSLYLIHQFNLTLVSTIVEHTLPVSTPVPVLITAKVLVHVLLATIFWYCFERPFLNRRTQGSVAVAASPSLPDQIGGSVPGNCEVNYEDCIAKPMRGVSS